MNTWRRRSQSLKQIPGRRLFAFFVQQRDLKVLQVADSVAFNVAIEDILSRADKEGRNPTADPRGLPG